MNPGQRVRLTELGRSVFRWAAKFTATGTVRSAYESDGRQYVVVARDKPPSYQGRGYVRPEPMAYPREYWEPIPANSA